ncbi:hypothetical protein [Acinetobacter sp. MD2(2019)]|uniref:hypothetical protein n=1 Tax=Acinetobacter sp. MD2(2019) TaxID=2605273 RepID=UPI002D1E9BDF|nr:hypothetical protein [Acinetobacter sp. MD2(2019)]MEB3753480.1 hypothetical protein [Acinetobacter sp. MD2(2019)]
MNKNDDFADQITQQLEKLAQSHEQKKIVMQNVLEHVQAQRQRRQNMWKMTSFALAATLAGFLVVPNVFTHNKPQSQQMIINTTGGKLSPQMVEDLEMVMVFGEDKNTHGS